MFNARAATLVATNFQEQSGRRGQEGGTRLERMFGVKPLGCLGRGLGSRMSVVTNKQ